MPEMSYRDKEGNPRDKSLWTEILGADDRMTWDASRWARFPAASSPAVLWPRLLLDAKRIEGDFATESTSRVSSHLHSYPAFLEFLARPGELSAMDVTVAANFTYASMPRVAILSAAALDQARVALN